MALKTLALDDFRLHNYPDARLLLDGAPLCVADLEAFTESTDISDLTAATGIATVLFNWCPDALAAFIDLDAWFSFTWSLTIQEGEADESHIEIGRIGNQITFGSLDRNSDNWTLMLTYNISMEDPNRGVWIPNPKESMKGDDDITDTAEIVRLSRDLVKDLILEKRWKAGRKLRHKFYIEYAPMDVWGDGIAMNPHWLYTSLSLFECTVCRTEAKESSPLQRCGRCGTAAYCSSDCQRKDWAVHKHICSLGLEDRGQMLAITAKGGLIEWDTERRYAMESSSEKSKNPNFVEPQLKRCK